MQLRRTTSLTAMVSFILLILTSIILYIVPEGRVAYWSDWHLFGLSKTQWGDLHVNLGVLFLIAICLHIYYNWKPIVNYLKNKTKELKIVTADFNAALILCLIFALGTYFMIPPFNWILDISGAIKDSAAIKYGEPPYGHAELSSIKSIASKMGLNLDDSLQRLKTAQIVFKDQDQTILDIARANAVSPKEIYAVMAPQPSSSLPKIPLPGTGNKTLRQLGDQFKINPAEIAAELKQNGIQTDLDTRIKDIAEKHAKTAIEIYDIIVRMSSKEDK